MREYKTIRALKAGEVVDLDGLKLQRVSGEIEPGDIYVAERNTGPKLLTCDWIGNECVFPTTLDYPYDTWECVRVEAVE